MIANVHKTENCTCLKCGRSRSDMTQIECSGTSMIFCTICFKQEFSHYSVIDTASNGWRYWYKKHMETKRICTNCGKELENTIKICTRCTYEYKGL